MASTIIGTIIDAPTSDASDGDGTVITDRDGVSPAPNDGGDTDEPTIIHGFDTVEPRDATRPTGNRGGRRGRPPGSRNADTGTRASKKNSNLTGIENLLLSMHSMGAAFLNVQELELDKGEAANLADAINRVSEMYGHSIDPRQIVWVNLISVLGMTYGPRVMAYRMRVKSQATGKQPKNVVDIRNTQPKPEAKVETNPGPQTPSDIFGLGFTGAIPDMA
jgi:hypothetical protein